MLEALQYVSETETGLSKRRTTQTPPAARNYRERQNDTDRYTSRRNASLHLPWRKYGPRNAGIVRLHLRLYKKDNSLQQTSGSSSNRPNPTLGNTPRYINI
eukprot:GHVQ01016849.1.p4 GENE.GHVQ01016849.1~~GHVQ01016849.1.p4  ORF type:complete len:101 (-),score=10.63 GHVQ01016849.1:1086-1388(-)